MPAPAQLRPVRRPRRAVLSFAVGLLGLSACGGHRRAGRHLGGGGPHAGAPPSRRRDRREAGTPDRAPPAAPGRHHRVRAAGGGHALRVPVAG